MKREFLMLGLGICISMLANAQIYELRKSCLMDDWIEVDTCVIDSEIIHVYHVGNYKIHAYSTDLNNNTTELKVVAVFKRTEWPTIGYNQVLATSSVDEIINDLRIDYGDNESRITRKVASKSKRSRKHLAQKY